MPSKSKKQAKTMTAACKSPEFRKKIGIPKGVACDFHGADKGKYHKEDIDMNEELGRIKKLAGIEPVAEKVELNASDDNPQRDAKASDVSQAMAMAKLKKTVEDRDDDDVDFRGLFTGVARGEISLDDRGKIAEAAFGIIKELEEACGKKHKKNMEEKELDETASSEKKKGRRQAGSYGRPGSEYQKRQASKSGRRSGKDEVKKGKEEVKEYMNTSPSATRFNDPKKIAMMSPEDAAHKAEEYQQMADQISGGGGKAPHDLHDAIKALRQVADGGSRPHYEDVEYTMFEKDSLSRIMVELIFEEMKKGKDAKEISEELAFAYNGVRDIVEVLKKKVSKITEMGRPRGGSHIQNVDYWDKPDDQLYYIIKDAGEAAEANREGDPAVEGKYLDQVNDAHTVLGWRKRRAAGVQEDGLPGYDVWKTATPYDNEPSDSDVEQAHEMGEEYGMDYLHTDKMAIAMVSDLKNPGTDPEDRKGLWSDLISDVAGTIRNRLEDGGNMALNDDEIGDMAVMVIKKHLTM